MSEETHEINNPVRCEMILTEPGDNGEGHQRECTRKAEWITDEKVRTCGVCAAGLIEEGLFKELRSLGAPGETGDFPDGKLTEDDEGGLNMGIGHNSKKGVVLIDFGKQVRSLGFKKKEAYELIAVIKKHADELPDA